MDEAHLYHAFAYVSLNPVRAGLVKRAEDWPWSSVRAHLNGGNDGITTTAPLHERIDDVARFLNRDYDDGVFEPLCYGYGAVTVTVTETLAFCQTCV